MIKKSWDYVSLLINRFLFDSKNQIFSNLKGTDFSKVLTMFGLQDGHNVDNFFCRDFQEIICHAYENILVNSCTVGLWDYPICMHLCCQDDLYPHYSSAGGINSSSE